MNADRFAAAVEGPTSAGQGVVGFLVIFFLALATFLLIRSMTGHLRKVRYSPDPNGEQDAEQGGTTDGPAGPDGGRRDG